MIHLAFTIQDVWNYVAPIVGACALKTLDHLYKVKRIRLLRRKDPIADSVRTNVLIEHKLEEILAEFQADRIYILQFHNGGNFYPTGKSIPKFSIFYEKTQGTTSILRDKYQNVPVSIFAKFFNYTAENNINYCFDIKKGTDDDFDVKGFTRDTDSKSTYCAAIKTLDDKYMGVLVVHYTKKKKVLSEEQIKNIQVYAASIGSAITVEVKPNEK